MTPRTPRRIAYGRWWQMINRCTNPRDASWQNYGARGISVCSRWLSFDAYYEDVGDCPASDMSLDRIDNDGDYEPGNVRWATAVEQTHNKRRINQNDGKTHCSKGHPYNLINTYFGKDGKRYCRPCKLAWQLAADARKRIERMGGVG